MGFGVQCCHASRTSTGLMSGVGFRVQGSGFRIQGSGFRVQGSGFRVQGAGCRAGFKCSGSEAGSCLRPIDFCITQLWA